MMTIVTGRKNSIVGVYAKRFSRENADRHTQTDGSNFHDFVPLPAAAGGKKNGGHFQLTTAHDFFPITSGAKACPHP